MTAPPVGLAYFRLGARGRAVHVAVVGYRPDVARGRREMGYDVLDAMPEPPTDLLCRNPGTTTPTVNREPLCRTCEWELIHVQEMATRLVPEVERRAWERANADLLARTGLRPRHG